MGCARLFGDYLGVIWEVFCEDFEGKIIQRVNAKTRKTVFFLFESGSLDYMGDWVIPGARAIEAF